MSSELTSDVLSEIAGRVDPLGPDFARFGMVCRSWRAAAVDNPRTWPNMPLLLLTEEDKENAPGGGDADTTRSFYSMSDDKFIRLTLPELCRRRCLGSTGGWLVTLGEAFDGDEILILNPITRVEISLPPLSSLAATVRPPATPPQVAIPLNLPGIDARTRSYQGFAKHVTLSCGPSEKKGSADCIALAVYGYLSTRLAYARPGDAAWTALPYEGGTLTDYEAPFETSAVYYNGHFYVVNYRGVVLRCCIPPATGISTADEPAKTVAFAGPPDLAAFAQRYLVESSGDMLQAVRLRQPGGRIEGEERLHVTVGFIVFRLADAGSGEWERLESLGDHALFLGLSTAVSVHAKDHLNCRKDCIYFTDDDNLHRMLSFQNGSGSRGGGSDMGWYSLEENAVYPLDKVDSRCPYSPPLWVMPSFQ